MTTRLPPLNALRTFEAAARHLSFTKAAAELFVTQAAVSHQIRTLEDHLGARLFRRANRALMLTDEGQALVPAVRDAFDRLLAGVRRVEDLCCGGALTISTTPSFAATWLAGRLVRFQALHFEIELHLGATRRLVDFAREGIDCGIRYGEGDWPGLRAERLFRTALMPVCSPILLGGPHPLRQPEDLAHHTLLHALDGGDDWRLWLRAAGVQKIDPTRGPKFDTIPLVLQAAISGAGVGIGLRQLVEAEVASGRLVAPFDLELSDECAWYFVTPEVMADQPKVTAFRDWLFEEVRRAHPARDGDTLVPV
jgi:LysR family transcriptional regulator, glycine cleavage system transcriptional activator